MWRHRQRPLFGTDKLLHTLLYFFFAQRMKDIIFHDFHQELTVDTKNTIGFLDKMEIMQSHDYGVSFFSTKLMKTVIYFTGNAHVHGAKRAVKKQKTFLGVKCSC